MHDHYLIEQPAQFNRERVPEVHAPNSKGGPKAGTARYGEPGGCHTDGHASWTTSSATCSTA